MSMWNRFYQSSFLNQCRGIYHQIACNFDAPQGLTLPSKEPWRLLKLIEKLRPINTEHQLIRIGPDGDGGYLVPNDLTGISSCYSPGVSTTIGFDLACAERGMQVFLADASVAGLPLEHPNLFFTKRFLACWEDETHTTLDAWVRSTQNIENSGDLMLQMDIEGAEYHVLCNISDSLLERFRILIIEFHNLDQLWNRGFLSLVAPIFSRILKTHYCVHLHPNNCCGSIVRGGLEIPRVMEFTFLRKDRVSSPLPIFHGYPHPLDIENTPRPPLILPPCWWNPAFGHSASALSNH